MAKVTTKLLTPKEIGIAVELLQAGECVAFPTETVYGLGANAFDEAAVKKIFIAKGRPADNPLIIHCFSKNQLSELVTDYHSGAEALMNKFWPGPLSLVLPKSDKVPHIVTGGLSTVAVRIPDHPLALALLENCGLPIAAPSANTSGKPSPTRAEHVYADLVNKIPAILDGGVTGWGVESTVLDCTCWPFRLLRPGGVTVEELRKVAPVIVDPGVYRSDDNEQPRSPGMKYQHYSPQATVILVVGNNIPREINKLVEEKVPHYPKIGVLATSESKHLYPKLTVLEMGSKFNLREIAANIYHLLREVDQIGLDLVFVEGFSDNEMGMAIMNRLRKAAGYQVVDS